MTVISTMPASITLRINCKKGQEGCKNGFMFGIYKGIDKQFPGEFPDGRLIWTMDRRMEENKSNDVTDDTQLAPDPDFSPQTPISPCNSDASKEDLDSFTDTATDISPIKFQMMSPLEDYQLLSLI